MEGHFHCTCTRDREKDCPWGTVPKGLLNSYQEERCAHTEGTEGAREQLISKREESLTDTPGYGSTSELQSLGAEAGMGTAHLHSSASYRILEVQLHAFLFIYLANFFKDVGKIQPQIRGLPSLTCVATYPIHWMLGSKKFHLNS